MARTNSAALLAALMVSAPAAVLAQATPAPVAPPAAAAADAANQAANATEKAADAAADAAAKAADAAQAAAAAVGTDAATPAADAGATGTTAEPAATPAAPAADAAASPAATADTDKPTDTAAAAPAPGPGNTAGAGYYTKSTHNDWTLRCMHAKDGGKDPCELYQLLKDDKGGPVGEASVIPFAGKAAAILNFVAPLETDLSTGMGLQVGNGKNSAYPFMVCAPIGCIARIGFSEAELGNLKKSSSATVSLLPFGGDPAKNVVKLNLSLKGFTAGFDAVSKEMAGQIPGK